MLNVLPQIGQLQMLGTTARWPTRRSVRARLSDMLAPLFSGRARVLSGAHEPRGAGRHSAAATSPNAASANASIGERLAAALVQRRQPSGRARAAGEGD